MYEGDDGAIATVKASPEEQTVLVGADPATFGLASHVGRYGWTTIRLDRVDPTSCASWWSSLARTAPKRAVAAFDNGLTRLGRARRPRHGVPGDRPR